jgi:hypothetical protein
VKGEQRRALCLGGKGTFGVHERDPLLVNHRRWLRVERAERIQSVFFFVMILQFFFFF